MNIFYKLKQDIINAAKQITDDHTLLELATTEIPKDTLNGDLSTNIAMIIAAKIRKNPREIALNLREHLITLPYIAHIEVAGGGFINFTLKANVWHDSIRGILSNPTDFTTINIGNGEKVNVEYVSANPTGPMHIGHARGAVYGDALARLLTKCGYDVAREYYINDAGSQVETLARSAYLRYEQALTGKTAVIPQGLYPGEYLVEVGKKLASQFGDKLMHSLEPERLSIVRKVTLDEMMILIKNDLKDLGIEHDVFFSEQSLHDSGSIDAAIEELSKLGLIYTGNLPAPKGKADNNWSERTQDLFKSTEFGDDQDRPIRKADGSFAYIAPDIAYAKNKIDRGFKDLIYVLGADHSGYVKRIEAVTHALSGGKVKCSVKICQIVNYVENGVPVKMSKRSGNFTTVKDVTQAVGKDIIRFIMLTRKNDAVLDFDLEKVKEQSKENPIFYVQYAHVRATSILANAQENSNVAYTKFLNNEFDLLLLSTEEEIQIIKLLASMPKILESAAKSHEPHRIAFYLLNIAAKLHGMWNLGVENNDYRFIVEGNAELTAARLALVSSIQKILSGGFDIIGITPLTKM